MQKNTRTAQMLIFAIIFTLAIIGTASAADNSSDNLTATSVDQVQTNDNSQTVTNQSTLNSSQTTAKQTEVNNNQSNTNTSIPDPQIWNAGVAVARTPYVAGEDTITIQNAINAAQDGDTIMLESGATFSGAGNTQITISKNLNFDVLNGGTATIDGLLTNWGFYISPGYTVTFNNIIFQNFVKNSFGAAIANDGVLSVTACAFIGNSAPYSGAIGNTGTCTVTDCTFTGNSATNNGGAIANDGTLTVTGSTFTSNTAASNGGAIASDGTLNINQCTFTGNNAASGGAISNLVIGNLIGTTTIHFSRIVGNTAPNGNAINNAVGGTVDAINNWWGHNTSPTQGAGNEIYGTVTYSPWLVLGITANPYSIYNQHTSTVTADLNHNYNGVIYADVSGLGHVMDGIPIMFTFTGAPLGTLNTNPANTLNGVATTIFTANTVGTSYVNAGLDSATVHTASNLAQTPCDIVIANNAVLTITKTADAANYNVGDLVTYTIHVTNNGPDAATNVVVTDTLPAGLTFGTATNGGTYNAGVITWILAYLAAGGNFHPSYTAYVNSDQQGLNIANTASTHNDQYPTDVTSQPVIIHICNAELLVTKTADKTNYNVGETVFYTIHVTNNGEDTATNLVVTDTLPAGLTFGTATNGGTYNAGTRVITWNLASLPVNGQFSPSFTATVNQGTQGQNIPNSANAHNDQNPTIISSPPVIIHINNAVLTITKTADKTNYKVGETVIYNIDVLNNGPDTATNVVVTDTLPAGLTFGTATNGGTYNAGTRVITWNVASLTQGAHFNPSFTATINTGTQGQTITNIAITTDTQNPTPVISPPTNIYVSNAVLTIKKIATQAIYNVGDTAIYNIDVLNNGPDTATNVVVTDTVPVGLTYISSTLGGIYDSASRTITWTLASLQNGVHFIATVDATVTPNAAGKHLVNTAQAKNDQINIPVKTTTTIYVPSSALEITKTVNNKTPLVNDIVIYTLIVQNHGPDTANSVKVSDVFTTGGLKFVSVDSINYGTYNPNTGIWTIGNLPANSVARLVLSFEVERAGTYTNLAKVTSLTFDPNLYPREATVTIVAKEPTPVVNGKTVAMQHTGLPIGALILAVLMILGGFVLPRRKN